MNTPNKDEISKSIYQGKNTLAENETPSLDFPVIGIGASAGGLEALQEFFKNMPEDSGAGFVVVQHLSPDYKSLMDELLSRVTNMYIYRVEDGMQINKNCIYLIPPGQNMTIFKGKLFLTKQQHGRSLNLPIDIFMRSLAKDQGKNAIGIVLSGTGSDGTLGIRAIKEYGGMVIAQDDQSAKFDGMPRSSISTGVVDYILPADKMPEELINYIKHPFIRKTQDIEQQLDEDDNQLSKIIMILRDEKGIDFSGYKSNTIIRRLEKRISINRFQTIEEYVEFLVNNKKEINILFKELLIGVTKFFRDESAFNELKENVLPNLFKDNKSKKPVRVWTIACSTGEEAYSLAILLKEYMAENNINREVKIFSTDIDTDSIEFASTGLYPESIISDISTERLSRFFNRKEEGYQVKESIRSMVVFAQHNILRDPPFSKIDLLSCRNMLIYLNSDIQQKVLSMFYVAINPEGYLFLGSSESVGELSEGFKPLNTKWKIYKYVKGYTPNVTDKYIIPNISSNKKNLHNISSYYNRQKRKVPKIESIFDEMMAEFLPPSVIVDENYDIIHTIHKVNKFMTIPVGQISFNLLKMLPGEVDVIVSSLLRRAAKKDHAIVYENLKFSEEPDKVFSISGKQIKSAQTGEIFFLVSFIEKDEEKIKNKKQQKVETVDINNQYQERVEELEKELQSKSESLQATVEELETSNEELQSSNEELIASNEELQSTNEELQSVNEELYTVNAEHQKKIEELTQLNADMDNLLKNTQIGTIYLDQDLTIRKFTELAANITNLLRTDIGRPIHHISTDHIYKNFINDIEEVMETLQPKEKEIQFDNNNWYLIRIIPFRTAENAVDGIIITLVNINTLKKTQKQTQKLSERLEMAFDMGRLSWWEWDIEENQVTAGSNKARMLGYKESDIGQGFEGWTRLLHPDDYELAMQAMRDHLQGKADSYTVEYRIKTKSGDYIWFKDKGGITKRGKNGKPEKIAGIVMDITQEKQFELEKKRTYEIVYQTMQQNPAASTLVDQNGKITYANKKAKELFNITDEEIKNRTYDDSKWKITGLDRKPILPGELPFNIVKNDGKPVADYKHYIQIGNKKEILLSISGSPVFDTNNKFKGAVFTLLDITEKHKIQQDLKENEEKYRGLFNGSYDPILVADTDRNIIEANKALYNLFGYNPDEIKGKKTETLYASKEEFHEMGKLLKTRQKKSKFLKTITYKKKNSAQFIGETSKFNIEDEHGKAKAYVGIIRDVTEALKYEQKMKMWESTFNSINDAIALIDEDYNILQYNDKFKQIFNVDDATIKNKKSYEIVHGTKSVPKRCVTCKTIVQKKHKKAEFKEPHINKYLRVSVDPVFDNNGNFEFAIEKFEVIDKTQ